MRRRSDMVNLYGAMIGSVMIGWALWEHSSRESVDNHYTLAVLVLGGVLINPLAILSLVRLVKKQRHEDPSHD